ncbi:MAG: AzlD domain-containing protein [Erysipelothrix sp.]|nr:AzlD domain-containing protein [Erysipelothrix sp.]
MYIILITIALGVMLTRFLPFLLLKNIEIPQKYEKVMNGIPYASMSLLLVYAFKDVGKHNLLETLIASLVCIGLYTWKRNTIISIVFSTIIYMLMTQAF